MIHRPKARSQAGFTVIELAIVVRLVGLVIVPLLWLAASSVGATRTQQTQAALETARDALIAYAAVNNGCLPFAADFEGGLPDTDASGGATPGYVDQGIAQSLIHGGDVPWADLGLTDSAVDGDGLRIQYYVANAYADNGNTCAAGFRGFQWNASVTYNGSASNPLYVYYIPTGLSRRLYKVIATLPGGTPPDTMCVGPGDPLPECIGTEPIPVTEVFTFLLPPSLLEVRRGPDITAASPQDDTISLQNVFVLIAPGKNRNAEHDRGYFRDSNHRANAGGSNWSEVNTNLVDPVVFSATPHLDATDSDNNGDDTLLVMSFINYKAMLKKYGLNMEPICDAAC